MWKYATISFKSVGELREVSNKWNNDELKLFLEVGFCLDLRPLSLLGKTTKEEILLFLKLYDPQKEKIRYVGRLFVKGSGKPLEVIPKLKELVGFSPDEEIDLFEEIKFEPSVMFEKIDCMLSFRDCELEDGDIVCYQKSLRNQCNEQYRFPDVPSYLEYVHNRQPEEHKVSDRTFDFPTETPQSTEVAPVNAKSELDDPGRSYLMDNTAIIEVVDVVPKVNDYVGLKNQGATCYLNSLLQTLYHIPSFRKAVYHMPTTENDNTSGNILLTLQSLFYKLQYNDTSVETKELTKSLGWDPNDSFIQHDVQEFNRVLCEKLEDKMKGTVVEGTIQQFLEGHHMSCTKCINVDFKSTKKGSFYDLQLDMKECCDVYDSFDKYVEVERLEDDNKYDAEQHGLQDALKSVLFIDFPPVLQLQLKRFKYDSVRDAPIKINDRYEFPLQLDLDRENGKYLSPDADRSVKNLYTLHSVLVHRGGVHGGHYYAYIRPTLSDQWYKFDDEFVTKEDRKRALDEGYGGDTKDSNAYLLVYIRESDKEKIICNVDEKDMAEHLRTRLKKEQEEKEQKRKEKAIIKAEEHKVSDPTSDFLTETPQPIEDTENTVVAHAVDHSAPVRFRWPINNFSRLNVKELYSDAFNAGGYSWRILIFPKGNNTDCLSMYLEVVDAATLACGWSRCAEFSLAVVNHIHHKLTVKIDTKHQFNANKSDWGFTSYMPLTELIDPEKGYLMDDKVIIEAEVAVPKVIDCSKLIV